MRINQLSRFLYQRFKAMFQIIIVILKDIYKGIQLFLVLTAVLAVFATSELFLKKPDIQIEFLSPIVIMDLLGFYRFYPGLNWTNIEKRNADFDKVESLFKEVGLPEWERVLEERFYYIVFPMEINGRRKIISKEFKPPENKKLTEEEMLNNRINGDRIMAGYGEMPVLDSEYIFKNDRPLEIFEYYDLPIPAVFENDYENTYYDVFGKDNKEYNYDIFKKTVEKIEDKETIERFYDTFNSNRTVITPVEIKNNGDTSAKNIELIVDLSKGGGLLEASLTRQLIYKIHDDLGLDRYGRWSKNLLIPLLKPKETKYIFLETKLGWPTLNNVFVKEFNGEMVNRKLIMLWLKGIIAISVLYIILILSRRYIKCRSSKN